MESSCSRPRWLTSLRATMDRVLKARLAFRTLLGGFVLWWHLSAAADIENPGLSGLRTISQRLQANLNKNELKQYASDPVVTVESDEVRFHAVLRDGVRAVEVTPNAIEVINRVSYAMAINRHHKGYLQTYLQQLAAYTGTGPVPALPPSKVLEGNRAIEVSNDHLSNFNQITAGLFSILLNYGQADAKSLPTDQWLKGLQKGIPNSLACAYGTEGLVEFFEAIEKIGTRPNWLEQLYPSGVKARKARRELDKIREELFR